MLENPELVQDSNQYFAPRGKQLIGWYLAILKRKLKVNVGEEF